MYAIAAFGLLLVAISLLMIVHPETWVDKAVRYCRLPYMHPLEIIIRIGFGVPFIMYAESSRYPFALTGFGYLLVGVGIGLVFVPPSLHRRFGIWSIQKIGRRFRAAGVFSLALGGVLLYAVL